MINQFAGAITSFLLQENAIKEDEKEIYLYGTEQILVNLTAFTAIGVIASFMHMWLETIFFLFGLVPLRAVAGGYHASTPRRCSALTFLVYVINMLAITVLEKYITLQMVILLLSLVVISTIRYAPVDHKNRTLRSEESIKAKRQSVLIVFILSIFCVGTAMSISVNNVFIISTMMGAVTASVSLIIGSIKRGGEISEVVKLVVHFLENYDASFSSRYLSTDDAFSGLRHT